MAGLRYNSKHYGADAADLKMQRMTCIKIMKTAVGRRVTYAKE